MPQVAERPTQTESKREESAAVREGLEGMFASAREMATSTTEAVSGEHTTPRWPILAFALGAGVGLGLARALLPRASSPEESETGEGRRGRGRAKQLPSRGSTTERETGSAPLVPGRRYKLRFPSLAALETALATEPAAGFAALSRRRGLVSAVAKAGQGWNQTNLDVFRERFGAEIVPDRRYTIEFDEIVSPDLGAPANPDAPSLHDVLELIGAPAVWETSRGQGVTIAIVDTGIDGTRPEFPASRRMGGWSPGGEDPWSDWLGHGTMVACIAAGRQDGPGTFNGVAPDAQLIACRTEFYDTELTAIYDHLTELARTGQRVVASNSFGIVSAWPPSPEESLDFPAALADAIEAGVAVVFSAGNNHVLAQGGPEDDHPNTIWLYKARADVLTVGACKPDGRMWPYSSRGPGQDHELDGNGAKPDVVAPTPPGGMVAYGSQLHTFRNGWGTSGACAEAAGLIALLWSCRPELSSDELFEIVRSTARPIAAGINSQGSGCIDCAAAMGALSGG